MYVILAGASVRKSLLFLCCGEKVLMGLLSLCEKNSWWALLVNWWCLMWVQQNLPCPVSIIRRSE